MQAATPRDEALDALRAFGRQDLGLADFQAFAREVNGQSDRATVIILAGALEAGLISAIEKKSGELPAETELKLAIGPNGKTANFFARIEVAAKFNIIDAQTRTELHTLRELRNTCAHPARSISFTTPQVAAVLGRVRRPNRSKSAKAESPLAARTAFIAGCAMLYQVLFSAAQGDRMSFLAAILDQVSERPYMPIEDFTKLVATKAPDPA